MRQIEAHPTIVNHNSNSVTMFIVKATAQHCKSFYGRNLILVIAFIVSHFHRSLKFAFKARALKDYVHSKGKTLE
jgi:hypothetical protein